MHVETGRHLYGGPRQVLLLMQGLAAQGHQGTLVCPAFSDVETAARELGLTVHGIRANGDLDLALCWRLYRLLRALRPDCVHVHSRRGADTFGGLAARLARVPAVLSRRVDSRELRVPGRFKYGLYRRIVVISARVRDQLLALGLPADKLRLVHSAVAPLANPAQMSRQAFLAEFGLPADAIPLAVVAQLIARKGHRYFLAALARLRPDYPELRAILFGVGRQEQALERQAEALGLADCVQFVGYYPEVNRVIGHFTLLVHPAEREGLGVCVLEAQAAGVPVVGFRVGGLTEAVADGRTGLLVPPGDVAALAAAIRSLLDDEPRRRALGAAGPGHIAEHFSPETMVAGNLAVYRELVGQVS